MQKDLPFEVPCIVNGKPVSSLCQFSLPLLTTELFRCRVSQVKSRNTTKQPLPFDHAKHLCYYHEADQKIISDAIDGALSAKEEWETLPWNDRAAIFLKAAELASGKYRYKLMAATMLGQGKNVWQAEIDAAAEVQ